MRKEERERKFSIWCVYGESVVYLFKLVTFPQFVAKMSIRRPGVATTISDPLFNSPIWWEGEKGDEKYVER